MHMHMRIFHRGLMATMIADLSASFRYEGLPILRWVPLSSSPQLSGSELPVHDPVQPQAAGQQPRQGGKYGTVSPVRSRAGDLPPQHRDLVARTKISTSLAASLPARRASQPSTRTTYR